MSGFHVLPNVCISPSNTRHKDKLPSLQYKSPNRSKRKLRLNVCGNTIIDLF